MDASYVATIRNDGGVTFDAIPLPGRVDSFTTVELADLDGDGDDEVILGRDENVDRGANSVIAEWNGTGFDLTELPRNNAFGPNHPMINLDTNVLDINGDGRKDIVFLQTSADTLYSGMTVQFLIQKSDGSFQDKTATYMNAIDMDFPNTAFDRWASDVQFADLDQDGDLDFVIQFAFPEGHRVFLQDDTGTFKFSQNDIGGSNESLTLVDYDFDGVDEIAAISPGFVVIYDNEELPRDLIYKGDAGLNIFVGTDADEVFQGFGARDTVEAGGGNDMIKGGDGNDKLFGEGGDDVIDGGADRDRILGGAGDDRIRGGDDKDRLIGNAGDDVLNGGGARDKISGGGDNDVIKGAEGSDLLLGGGGNDRLEGGTGADKLNGGRGNDKLKGGADADTFSFSQNGGDEGVSETLCMRLSPCGFDGSFIEPFWV